MLNFVKSQHIDSSELDKPYASEEIGGDNAFVTVYFAEQNRTVIA
jgi:hypothetical protein